MIKTCWQRCCALGTERSRCHVAGASRLNPSPHDGASLAERHCRGQDGAGGHSACHSACRAVLAGGLGATWGWVLPGAVSAWGCVLPGAVRRVDGSVP